jgi:hypothetical protein
MRHIMNKSSISRRLIISIKSAHIYKMLNAGGTNDDQQPKCGIKVQRFGDLSLSCIRAKCPATVKNSLTINFSEFEIKV